MNTVGAHHRIGFGRRAVGETEPDAAVRVLFERCQLMPETQIAFGHHARQSGVQIASVRQQVRRTIAIPPPPRRRSCRSERHRYHSPCCSRNGDRRRPHAKAAQDRSRARPSSRCSRSGCRPRCDEAPRLFINSDLDFHPPQRGGGRKTAIPAPITATESFLISASLRSFAPTCPPTRGQLLTSMFALRERECLVARRGLRRADASRQREPRLRQRRRFGL